jgi:hypothetical protein
MIELLHKMINQGFQIEIKYLKNDELVQVRVTAPSGQVNIGYDNNIEKALINALLLIILKLSEQLAEEETRSAGLEDASYLNE